MMVSRMLIPDRKWGTSGYVLWPRGVFVWVWVRGGVREMSGA